VQSGNVVRALFWIVVWHHWLATALRWLVVRRGSEPYPEFEVDRTRRADEPAISFYVPYDKISPRGMDCSPADGGIRLGPSPDRDRAYGEVVTRRLRAQGIRDRP
jgi:hypothetical protein